MVEVKYVDVEAHEPSKMAVVTVLIKPIQFRIKTEEIDGLDLEARVLEEINKDY